MPILPARHAFRVPRPIALLSAVFAMVMGLGCSDSAPTEPLRDAPLVGTVWQLVSVDLSATLVAAAPPDRIPYLHFNYVLGPPRLYVGGFGGCNGFGGRYEATPDGAIWIDSLMATRIGCAGDLAVLEDAYMERLYATASWNVQGDSLLLQAADARQLLFVRYCVGDECAQKR